MTIALDIGRFELKLVQMQKTSKGFILEKALAEPVFQDLARFDPEKITSDLVVEAGTRLFAKAGIKPRRVKNLISGLSNQHTSIRQVKMVSMDDPEELQEALQLEARKHIPMDGTDAMMDYQILSEDPLELDKVNILMVASTQRNLQNHLGLLQRMGLRPGIVDADAVALANAYIIESGLPDEGTDVFLNVGALSSTLVVWGRRAPFFTRDIQIAGHHFTQELVKRLDISYVEAEELKKQKPLLELVQGQSSGEGDFRIQVAEHTVFDDLVDEIRRSLRFYLKESNTSTFNRILLTGGAGATPGLAEYIQERLNIPVEFFNPLTQCLHKKDLEVPDPSKFSIAMGMAMRALME